MNMMYYGPHPYAFFGFLGSILSAVFWIVIIVLIFRLIKRGRRHSWHRWNGFMAGGALETLRERYAKGEITKEEYEERKKVLLED